MRKLLGLTATLAAVALAAAGCGGSDDAGSGGSKPGTQASDYGNFAGQNLDVLGVWSGDEQKAFQKVLDAFQQKTGAKVNYTSAGDNLPTVLQTRVSGKNPPNVAFLAQPGLIQQFAKAGNLVPLGPDVVKTMDANMSGEWKNLGSVDGKPYAVYYKAANKSTVWYNATQLEPQGFQAPATWADMMSTGKALADAGITPFAVGGADGWTLTDWFENIYLQTAGPENYDKLAKHEIKWTDPTVKTALQTLQQLFGQDTLMAGGHNGALQTDFPTSVTDVFGGKNKAAIVYEGDFVTGNIKDSTKAVVGKDAKFFPFPTVAPSTKPSVVSGGDAAVAMKDTPATQALMKFIASPEAASIWAKQGGFLSPNKNVPATDYPDETTKNLAKQLIDAGDNFRFDMSDQAPTQFGATKGQGEWKDLQDFLANPKDIDGAMKRLEADAAKAYKS
ncbi:ABC transporter substrate-binding protein [Labedaea rhizosphaerae]|uniref:Carbohydrate ABC transporter substrate-binding protein (CUT1 family) n=1 Tax=Labedaea rhizosphaerae TaxID=598644 RepID=A0A4R6RWA7_LABRH|nr:substrate-binding domain-containing protein [Labedaea rhizosphaerae]TDP90605.1 carbohydrate ABC transporter substrate-binding protein (CUT1 family) [Labedaea rhizosphaerae]